jgi:tetratricopeptide (TPR) repeat protein
MSARDVFISAVSSEFGKARDALASDLRARELHVAVQSDFTQGGDSDTLLQRLHDYIRDCRAVVCLIGARSGGCPPPPAARPFAQMLPKGVAEATYTQWEFYFASHYKRRIYRYIAKDYAPDDPVPRDKKFTELQQAFLQRIYDQGLHWTEFSSAEQLSIAVLREPTLTPQPANAEPAAGKPIVLPFPSIGSLFKGRDEFMVRLRESLRRGEQTAIVSQALYGLGGIGKTRAAVEYAWAHRDDYSALLFVVAESPEGLRRNLAALAGALVPKFDTTDDNARLAAALGWLRSNPGWFLILDNVDTRLALTEVERQLSGLAGGHVVVTSRLADFSGTFKPLELDVLAVDDGAAFLLARTEGRRRAASDDAAKARKLALELGQLALAMEQAAAYIGKRRLTIGQYLEQWGSKHDEVLGWFDATVTGYPRAVAVTWQTSVEQLSEGGRRLLQRLSFLAPEKVPEALLDVSIPGAEAENLYDAFDDLAAYSLVTRDADGPYFLVHRLVQDVTRRNLAGEARQQRLAEAVKWIDAAFVGRPDDVRHWPTLDPLAPHSEVVVEHADAAGIVDPTPRLMDQLGELLQAKAQHAQAEPLMRRALAIEEKLRPDDPVFAYRLNVLVQLLQATNRFAEAEPLMRRALAIDEQTFGPDHPDVARDLNGLAVLLQDTNRLAAAEPLLRRALAIDEKSFGADHRSVARDLRNLAALLQATNRLVEAEAIKRRALAIDEKDFGPDHPNVARDLNSLAVVLKATNRLAEAERLMRRALAIDERCFGADHPDVARDLNNLAVLLRASKRPAEAEPLCRRALAIDERCFGPDHPKVAIRLTNLAGLLKNNNRLTEAEPMVRRALVIDEKSFGPDHPKVATHLNNLAGLLQATDRLGEAEPVMRRALAIDEQSFGPDHPDVAIDLNNFGRLLHDSNRLSEAEPLLRRAAVIFVEFARRTGHPHPHLNTVFANYSALLKAMGKPPAEIETALAALKAPLAED